MIALGKMHYATSGGPYSSGSASTGLPATRRRTQLEDYLIYAGVFLAPFLNLQTSLMFFTLSDALISLALGVMILRGRLPRNPFGSLLVFWITAFLLVTGGLFLSSVMAGQIVRGVVLCLQYFFCFIILPYVLLSKDEAMTIRLLIIFIFGVVAVDLHGIYTFYTIGYVPGSRVVTGGERLATLIGNANGAGTLNAMMIIAVIWLRLHKHLSLLVATFLLAVMGWVVILTSSNTALLATIIGLAVFVLWTLRPKMIVGVAIMAAISMVFLQFGGIDYLPSTFQKRVVKAVEAGDISEAGTFADRADLMIEALDMVNGKEFDLTGIGADRFRVVSVQGVPVHNAFLILWVEGGILSLLGWTLFSAMGLILWLQALNQRVATDGSAAVIAVFASFIILANASPHIYARPWHMALLLVMGPTILQMARPRPRAAPLMRRPSQPQDVVAYPLA